MALTDYNNNNFSPFDHNINVNKRSQWCDIN